MLKIPLSDYYFLIDYSVIIIKSYQLQATLNSEYTPDCNNVVIEKKLYAYILGFCWFKANNWTSFFFLIV